MADNNRNDNNGFDFGPGNQNGPEGGSRRSILATLLWLLIPLMIVASMYSSFRTNLNDTKEEYYQIVQYFDNNQVKEYNLNIGSGKLTYVLKGEKEERTYSVPSVEIFVNDIHESVHEYNLKHPDKPIKMNYEAGASSSWLYQLLPVLLSTVLMVLVLVWLMRRMNTTMMNDANRSMGFGKARIRKGDETAKKVTFDDVAGADEEKEELEEIVGFLKDPKKYDQLGARIPKGVLLVGPPGTGKTLLARATAGEANAPFFSISGSDFVEMFVGVGASRVRDLFDTAKKNAPAIIFIDEIDAVGRHRGAGMGGGHDEREQTLNQLLVEMDGFEGNLGIVVIAATNRPDILDPALLRPGRFDRQVTVNYPDIKGREAILKIHARNKPLGPDVDLHEIACTTAGFTGADLENLLNEAALLAARKGKKAIVNLDIKEAAIKVMVGPEKKSRRMTYLEKKLTAYHESGHAITNYYLKTLDPVSQVSVIPRGGAGGYTMSVPVEDRNYSTKTVMLDNPVTLLGGRVAESIILGDISTGASNDIERATKLAKSMITKYGMNDKLGTVTYGSDSNEVFLGMDYNRMRDYSEATASAIDREVVNTIHEAYQRAEDILRTHVDQLHQLAQYLMVHEKIEGPEFYQLMGDSTFGREGTPYKTDGSLKTVEELHAEGLKTEEEQIAADKLIAAGEVKDIAEAYAKLADKAKEEASAEAAADVPDGGPVPPAPPAAPQVPTV